MHDTRRRPGLQGPSVGTFGTPSEHARFLRTAANWGDGFSLSFRDALGSLYQGPLRPETASIDVARQGPLTCPFCHAPGGPDPQQQLYVDFGHRLCATFAAHLEFNNLETHWRSPR